MDWLIGIGLTVLVCVIGVLAYQDSQEWGEFKVSQHCVKVGEQSSSTTVSLLPMPGGQIQPVVSTTPGKTGFKCDDGVTYWR